MNFEISANGMYRVMMREYGRTGDVFEDGCTFNFAVLLATEEHDYIDAYYPTTTADYEYYVEPE